MRLIIFISLLLLSSNLASQNIVNHNLFGFRTTIAFILFDTKDSLFINDIKNLSPNVLSFPGGYGNFYHLDGPGYGLKLDEINKYQKHINRNEIAAFFNKIVSKKKHSENYIYDFIKMAKETGSSIIYDANIITSTPEEVLRVIKILYDSGIKLLGIELGGELYDRSYSHFMNIEKYISLARLYADEIRRVYKNLPIAVVSAPNNRGSMRLTEWNYKLAKESFYDAIIIHPYAKVVKGRDAAGQMLTVISEGTCDAEVFEIYKDRAINYITSDFKFEIDKYNKTYKNKKIWLTEWNLQMSPVTGNTLLQALFVSHQLIELASLQNSNIDIVTFHNLAGRTISGSMIMKRNNKTSKNATYNSMIIVKELFRDSLYFSYKSEIFKDCFEYCFTSKNKNQKFYYWVNWSPEHLMLDINLKGNQFQYFGKNLFDKNLGDKVFKFMSKECDVKDISLKPYSITFAKGTSIK